MNIYEKLSTVQNLLRSPKNQYNAFGKYKYRNLEDILEAVKPLLYGSKLTLVICDEPVLHGDRTYIRATAILVDTEKPEEKIINIAYAREALTKKGQDDSQITGATSSYARKYCLNGLFLIDDTKDADSMDNKKPEAKPESKKLSAFLEKMKGFATNETYIYWSVLISNGYKKASDIPKNMEETILKEMNDKLKEK